MVGCLGCQISINGDIFVGFQSYLVLFLSFLAGLAYDVFKDTYKIYADGEKLESGSWSENPNVKD